MELVLRQSSQHLTATFEVDCFAGVLVAVGEYSRDRVANAQEFIKEQFAQSKKERQQDQFVSVDVMYKNFEADFFDASKHPKLEEKLSTNK